MGSIGFIRWPGSASVSVRRFQAKRTALVRPWRSRVGGRGQRVVVSQAAGGGDGAEAAQGDEVVQEVLERALRKSIAEMKAKKAYGDAELDEIRRLGEDEIRALADSINAELEQVREDERQRMIDSEASRRLDGLLAKFDKQAGEIEEKMESEKALVLEEAEKIRSLTEELAEMRDNGSDQLNAKEVVLFFLSWTFALTAVYYIWRGVDSNELQAGVANATVNAFVSAICFVLYNRTRDVPTEKKP